MTDIQDGIAKYPLFLTRVIAFRPYISQIDTGGGSPAAQ